MEKGKRGVGGNRGATRDGGQRKGILDRVIAGAGVMGYRVRVAGNSETCPGYRKPVGERDISKVLRPGSRVGSGSRSGTKPGQRDGRNGMAMKKSDMESCHARYGALLAEAQAAAREVRCGEAMELAVSSFEYIDGMLQYARRQKTPVFNIQAIDMVLEYAPLLFSFSSLDALESLLKSCRRIAKQAPLDYSGKLATARDAMWEAHRLWDYLEQHPDAPEDEVLSALGGDEGRWRWAIAAWERLGLLRRAGEGGASRLEVGTRMGKLVPGKCPSCGVVTEGPKAMFLEEMACPACGVTVLFVILAREGATADEKE